MDLEQPFIAARRASTQQQRTRLRRAQMIAGAVCLGVGALLVWLAANWRHDSDIAAVASPAVTGFSILTWIAGALLALGGAVFTWRYFRARR